MNAPFHYNFKAQFVPAVESGAKRQTIRREKPDGRRPRPGDSVRFYAGLRTKNVRKIGEALAIGSLAVQMDYQSGSITIDSIKLPYSAALQFAQEDGFDTVFDMLQWFKAMYQGEQFEGYCVKWQPLQQQQGDRAA